MATFAKRLGIIALVLVVLAAVLAGCLALLLHSFSGAGQHTGADSPVGSSSSSSAPATTSSSSSSSSSSSPSASKSSASPKKSTSSSATPSASKSTANHGAATSPQAALNSVMQETQGTGATNYYATTQSDGSYLVQVTGGTQAGYFVVAQDGTITKK